MIYVYAVTEPPSQPVLDVRGIGERPVEVRVIEGMAVAFSRHDAGAIAPTAEHLWRHEATVESLMRHAAAVLPARFGTTFAAEAQLDAALARHADRLAAALERVRGCVELGLRVMWQAPESAEMVTPEVPNRHDSGRAYMLARLAEEQRRREVKRRADEIADGLHRELAPLARDSTRRVLPTPRFVLAAAYLVPGERVGPFRDAVRRAADARPDLRLLCTGPWPPYHFAPALEPAEARHG